MIRGNRELAKKKKKLGKSNENKIEINCTVNHVWICHEKESTTRTMYDVVTRTIAGF